MKMKFVAAAALLAVGMSAQAEDQSVVGFSTSPGFYQSVYSFSLAGLGSVSGDVDFLGATQGVSVSLFNGVSSMFDADAADGFSFSGLAAGNYQIAFTAFGTGAGAFGGHYVTAVPEPETYALMLAGLGAVGFMARRRRQD